MVLRATLKDHNTYFFLKDNFRLLEIIPYNNYLSKYVFTSCGFLVCPGLISSSLESLLLGFPRRIMTSHFARICKKSRCPGESLTQAVLSPIFKANRDGQIREVEKISLTYMPPVTLLCCYCTVPSRRNLELLQLDLK